MATLAYGLQKKSNYFEEKNIFIFLFIWWYMHLKPAKSSRFHTKKK